MLSRDGGWGIWWLRDHDVWALVEWGKRTEASVWAGSSPRRGQASESEKGWAEAPAGSVSVILWIESGRQLVMGSSLSWGDMLRKVEAGAAHVLLDHGHAWPSRSPMPVRMQFDDCFER